MLPPSTNSSAILTSLCTVPDPAPAPRPLNLHPPLRRALTPCHPEDPTCPCSHRRPTSEGARASLRHL
ncbi:MAG: hypothetical protein MZV70_62535 [Desulfobacterales bacterium]|nr:hypothetical protein [Desulfobacterales bacterium]